METPIVATSDMPIIQNQEAPVQWVSSNRILFKQRFLKIAPPHMRVNRSWFLLNVLFIGILGWIILNFLPWILGSIFVLFLAYLTAVQIIKRCHDFNNNGKLILGGIVLLTLALTFWPALYYSMISDNIFASIGFYMQYGVYIMTIRVMPYIILSLIPGNPEENEYGASYGL